MAGGETSERSDKPHATSENVKAILSSPARLLTAEERAERIDFYADNPNVHAVPVEPATFVTQR